MVEWYDEIRNDGLAVMQPRSCNSRSERSGTLTGLESSLVLSPFVMAASLEFVGWFWRVESHIYMSVSLLHTNTPVSKAHTAHAKIDCHGVQCQ